MIYLCMGWGYTWSEDFQKTRISKKGKTQKANVKPVICDQGKHQYGTLPNSADNRSSYNLIWISILLHFLDKSLCNIHFPTLKWTMASKKQENTYFIIHVSIQRNNNLWRSAMRWSSFDVQRSFVNCVNTPSHNPERTSQSMFTNFTHVPTSSKWRWCFWMLWSKVTLNMVPTVGNVHNRSLGRGRDSNCKGSGSLSSSSSLQSIVKSFRLLSHRARNMILWIQTYSWN